MHIKVLPKSILTVVTILASFFNPCMLPVCAQQPVDIGGLKFIGQYQIPFDTRYKNTVVGGLSAIDYDAAHQCFYLISDDRSALNPARYYTASIAFSKKGIDTVRFTSVHFFKQPNGGVYPGTKQDPYHTPDPEGLRYNPILKQLLWSSEGERLVTPRDTILVNPTIISTNLKDKYLRGVNLPQNLIMQAEEKGPRQNGVLEGLTFMDQYTC